MTNTRWPVRGPPIGLATVPIPAQYGSVPAVVLRMDRPGRASQIESSD